MRSSACSTARPDESDRGVCPASAAVGGWSRRQNPINRANTKLGEEEDDADEDEFDEQEFADDEEEDFEDDEDQFVDDEEDEFDDDDDQWTDDEE